MVCTMYIKTISLPIKTAHVSIPSPQTQKKTQKIDPTIPIQSLILHNNKSYLGPATISRV